MDNKNIVDDEVSINYVIATYSGLSPKREKGDKGITKHILQMHLDKLIEYLPTTKYIKQVTITKPYVDTTNTYKEYYDIDDKVLTIEKEFNIPVRFIEMKNNLVGLSYSQYRMAYKEYPTFDFYLLMEDDWVPFQNCFDELLLKEWKKKYTSVKENGYLCLWYAKCREPNYHAAISVGIISNIAMLNFDKAYGLNDGYGQYSFSNKLEQLGTCITDFSDDGHNYRILFWESSQGVIYDFSNEHQDKSGLLVPLHYSLKIHNNYDYDIVSRSF